MTELEREDWENWEIDGRRIATCMECGEAYDRAQFSECPVCGSCWVE